MDTGRVVVITGAAGGIGTPIVRRFLDNGDTVIATDAAEDSLGALKSHVEDHPGLLTLAAEVSSDADTQAVAEFARGQRGSIEILINCAGFFPIEIGRAHV